jgi:hypothetical protein
VSREYWFISVDDHVVEPPNLWWDRAFVVRYEGTTFHLVPEMDPICGQTIPGKTVG